MQGDVAKTSDRFFKTYEPKCGKNAPTCDVEKSFDADPEADDFQNLTGFFSSKDTSLENFYEDLGPDFQKILGRT